MRILVLAIGLSISTLSPLAADQLLGPWRVEVGGETHSDGPSSAGETTIVHHDGKVYYSTWSSGAAPPTMDLVGKADPTTLKKLSAALVELKKEKPNKSGKRSFYLEHNGKGINWNFSAKSKSPKLERALQLFQATVKGAKTSYLPPSVLQI